MNQVKNGDEIQSKQCQNGDKNQGIKIKRDIKLYLSKSYEMAVFLCQRMFNTITAKNFLSGLGLPQSNGFKQRDREKAVYLRDFEENRAWNGFFLTLR